MAVEGIDKKQLEELAEAGASVTVPAALLLALVRKIEMLEEEVAELKRNSRNSSRPPSSDRGKPNRPKGGAGDGKGRGKRKQGGQPGHGGHTLRRTANPDNTVTHHLPASCGHCGAGLAGVGLDRYDTRQVFDLPSEIKVEVTEHRAAVGTCTCCGKRVKAQFPEGVAAPVQYGARIRALVVYLHVYQLLPCGRLSELCADVFNCRLSPGTVANLLHGGGSRAGPLAEKIKGEVRGAPFMHLDETGMNLFGKNHWLHTASTPRFTYLHIDAKRGRDALEATGVLEGYTGWAIHDFFPSYYHYAGCGHGLCNAHHLRDLTYVDEELGQRWAGEMIGLLLEAKAIKDREANGGRKVGPVTLGRLQDSYFTILKKGYALNPEPVRRPGQRGKLKRGKALNLLNRFRDRHEEVMAFLIHGVPFDNNEAERDLRMMKTKQKISGCFRSQRHAKAFADLRSIIASAKKMAINTLEILRATLYDTRKAESLLFGT